MSNIYLKVTIETFSRLWFSGFKKFVTGSVLGSSNSCRYHWILKLLFATYKSDAWEQNFVWLFYYFNLKGVMTFQRVHTFCWTKIFLIKTKRNRKWKIANSVLESWTLCFSSHKYHKLKVKLWWVGVRERKKKTFFYCLFSLRGIFFKFVFYLNL